ncbi:MAG: hypothetical protein FJ306_05355 [Planctomycetes bacterium]|nr:hypothetical protein [Planctomycetota bacterium]
MAVAPPDLRAIALYEGAKAYHPTRPFDGHCMLARPRTSELLATWWATPFLGWEPWLTGRRDLVEVDGAHDALLHAPAVDAIAKRLSELPCRARPRRPSRRRRSQGRRSDRRAHWIRRRGWP